MADEALLERLCEVSGISGDEQDVRTLIQNEAAPYAESMQVTPLGNLIVAVKGKKRAARKLMVTAHMDEPGLLVTQILEDGSLRFTCTGEVHSRTLFARHVTVAGKYPGVIGGRPIHLLRAEERGKAVSPDELVIDIGAADREEAAAAVSPGDSVTFAPVFEKTGGHIFARALGSRTGCAMMLELIRGGLEYDTTFCFTVQEEAGRTGAGTAAYEVRPEAALVLDAVEAGDVKGTDPEKQVCRLHRGPVVPFIDRSTIYDKTYCRLAFDLAGKAGLPCQTKEQSVGGTDAGTIHISRGGVRCAAVLLPCRYLHAPVGMISCEDYGHTLELVRALSEKMAGDTL